MSDLRSRLESTAFADLGAMMEGYAQAAVELARKDFRHELDFTADSIDALDDILVVVAKAPNAISISAWLWEATQGGLAALRWRRQMTQYPGGTVAVPAVDVRGSYFRS
jgi:hypothetical protein